MATGANEKKFYGFGLPYPSNGNMNLYSLDSNNLAVAPIGRLAIANTIGLFSILLFFYYENWCYFIQYFELHGDGDKLPTAYRFPLEVFFTGEYLPLSFFSVFLPRFISSPLRSTS